MHLGIDLGTTYSLIGYVNAHGQPALFPDFHDANEFRTSSVVHIGAEGCLIGQTVEELLEEEPELEAVRFSKLRLGDSEPIFKDYLDRDWSASAVSALVLKKLLRNASTFAHEEIGHSIVTVPAQFNDIQRKATRYAAQLAGLRQITLVEEPVAAATYYGLHEGPSDRTLFVYDLGGGTFDATVLQTSKDGLYVLATEGTNSVGGKAFDEAIMQLVATDFDAQYGISALSDPVTAVRLRQLGEDTKIKLSKPGRGQVKRSMLLSGKPYEFILMRSQFEALIQPYVDETLDVCERCLAGAGLEWGMVDKILLTGGSSLVPMISEQVRLRSGKTAADVVSQQPHQAVAYGAAILAQRFAKDIIGGGAGIQQVANSSLGMRVWDRKAGRPGIEELIKRNSPLPASYTRTFYTTRPDQIRLILDLVQTKGEEEEPTSLGYFEFGPIENPRKNYPIEVTVTYDAEGTVTATARDEETGQTIDRVFSEDAAESPERFGDDKFLVDSVRVNE